MMASSTSPNEGARPRRGVRHMLFAVAAVSLSLFGPAWLGLGCATDEPRPAADSAPVAVRVAPIVRADLARSVAYVGTVHSRREVEVVARTAGRVIALSGEGETVGAGRAVARIAVPEIKARVSRLEAELQRAETERDFLCDSFQRDQRLAETGAISKTQLDRSRRACENANAAVAAARAGRREIGAARGKSSETAPFAGRVLQWLAEPGQNVMPGSPLLVFGSHDLEVRAAVGERDLARGVRDGIPARVRLGEKALRLAVASVAPMATGPGRTTEVTVALPGDVGPGHGTSVRVDFVVAEAAGAVAVPAAAIAESAAGSIVFVIEGGRARAVAVAPGIRDRGHIGVDGELAVGDMVAVSNLELLEDGSEVFAVRSSGRDGQPP